MNRFLSLAVLVGALWAIDAYAFRGRYSNAVWEEVNQEAHMFNNSVQYFLRKISP